MAKQTISMIKCRGFLYYWRYYPLKMEYCNHGMNHSNQKVTTDSRHTKDIQRSLHKEETQHT